jgi:polar amino acid transport system substrate-binding protein
MQLPVAPIGLSVFEAADKSIQGVYPDVLRNLSGKEGCEFVFSMVPRARLEALFESGRADMLIPASRSSARDALGVFVPLIYSRATLLSLTADRLKLRSAQDLIDRRELKVGIVRGFDFGPAYQALVKELGTQGRLVQDVDATSIARLLQSDAIDVTIMAPSILLGAILVDPKTAGLADKLRSEPIDELPWGESGVYLSKTALDDANRAALQELLERAARSGAVWKAFQRYYTAAALTGSIRAR